MKSYFLVVFCVLSSACASQKLPVQRNTQVEDINGVHSRAEYSGQIRGGQEWTAENEHMRTPEDEYYRILKKTNEYVAFEAVGEGVATKYERLVDAEARAEENALSKAVKASGVNVYSGLQDVMSQYGDHEFQFVGKYVSTWSNALIPYERIGQAACAQSEDVSKCSVKIRGRVYFNGVEDPLFELSVDMGKPLLFEGDNVAVKVSVTKDAYITVLGCDEDGNVTLLFPNRYARDNFLSAGKELYVPGDYSFQLKAMLPSGRAEVGEMLHVIATKNKPLVLLDALKEEKNGGFITYSLGGLKDIVSKLAKNNRSDWTTQVRVYRVLRK